LSSVSAENVSVWARGGFLGEYAHRQLRPVEVIMLVRYREDIRGRVLELGCGAGRLTGYLASLARETHGVDVEPQMVAHCQRQLPHAHFHQADFRDLSFRDSGSFDAVLAPCNALDVLADDERRAVLDAVHGLLVERGLLIMSSHNRGHVTRLRHPTHVRKQDPLRFAVDVARLPRRIRNSRRLASMQRDEPGYAIVNDSAYNFSLLHYYISRDAQQQQFADHGFELIDCLDIDGRWVGPGEPAPDSVELHYAARKT